MQLFSYKNTGIAWYGEAGPDDWSLVDAKIHAYDRRFGGFTPLHMAAEKNSTECIRLLLAAGADINRPQSEESPWRPLTLAAYYGHTEALAVLLAHGADADTAVNGLTPAQWLWQRHRKRMPIWYQIGILGRIVGHTLFWEYMKLYHFYKKSHK